MKHDNCSCEVRPTDVCPEVTPAKSYKVWVIADSSGEWCSNGVAFKNEEDAKDWGEGLFMRWTAVRQWEIRPSEEEANR